MKKNQLIVWLIAGLLGWGALQTFAGGGPCNYIVLYDQTDTNSIAVANYYQQVRDIPERNMVPYTFFPAGKTSYARTNLWDLAVYLRQVIQERGLTGRFNGIAVAGSVPLLGTSFQLGFQSGLYFSPGFTRWGEFTNTYNNKAFTSALLPPTTREIRDDKPFINGVSTNVYWPVSFVGFTGVNGNTPDEVFALLDRSKAADGLRPDGVVYWPTNTGIRSTTREDEINDVSAIWKARGIRYLVSDGGPMSINTGCPDIAGVFGGTAQADLGINGNTYVPGAWADHLTSNGGNLNTLLNGQSSACAWIRAGAYGSSGTAAEPYAVADKFPHAHIHTHLRAGATMAEAYWQSMSTPQEIVMVGDPLLQAWAQIPQVSISSPADDAILSGTVSISASASTASPDGLEAQYELAVDGHIVRTNDAISATWNGSGFSLDTTTLADGWHEVRVIAYNNNAIHTQGEDSRTVFVNNSSQSVALSGPSALEYTSNGTFTVSLNGIANATNVTIQANGRTLATLSTAGGNTNLSGSLFGYKGVTKLYALAWLNNGKQVWSAPLSVNLSWAPAPATNVTPGASIAQVRYFSSTTNAAFDWDSAIPDVVTNFFGPVLAEGFKTAIKYRSYAISTNYMPTYVSSNYANRPGFDSSMYFLAPVEGLYEFMVDDTSITNVWMDVDGQRIRHGTSTSDGNIKPVPVKLAAGFHPIRLRFQATASDYSAELFYRGGISPGNINADTYSNYLVQRMNEIVCFGPAAEGNAAPVITDGPSIAPASKTTQKLLSVGATDPDGNTNALVYSWMKIDGPGQMTVSANNTGTCFTNLATFSRAGNYRIRLVVSDGFNAYDTWTNETPKSGGGFTTNYINWLIYSNTAAATMGEVTVAITSIYSTVVVSPAVLTVRSGTTNEFFAVQKDQFGSSFTDRPFVWSVVGGGTVTSNGIYIAPSENSTNQVVATVGANSASSTIIVLTNFAPTISAVQVKNNGDYFRCSVTASDDMGTNNLTYTWEPVGAQPSTLTFSTNGTSVNPVDAYFTRFGTYAIRVGVTDSSGSTVWSSTNTVTAGPTLSGSTLIDTNGNNNGRIDQNETADLFVTLYRTDSGTNLPISAVLSVTNTPGLTVVQSTSDYPTAFSRFVGFDNLVPFGLSADSELIDVNPRNLVLTVTIGGASGDLPFSLVAGEPYTVTASSGASIVPGTTDTGVHAALRGGTNVFLPFAYNFGGQSFTNVFVNGNGILQFSSQDTQNYYGTIPDAAFSNMIAVHWELLRLDLPGKGIFTSVSGTAPNRIFNIEWRAVRYFDTNQLINCEARLFESEPRVDMIYGTVGNNGAEASVGVQLSPESYLAYSSQEPVLTNGLQLSFVMKSDTGVPTAHFTASPTSGWAPLPVTFSDTSTGGITNRFWDFGDGTTLNTTAISVSHTYTSAGTYTVGLTVSGEEGASTNIQTDCVTVTIPVAPSAGFNLTPASGTAPLSVSFADTSTGDITNRFWSFGDGATTNTTETTVSHIYTVGGTNTVQLIVSGPAGSSTDTQAGAVTVTLPPPPVANFSASPVSGAVPLIVTFTDTSTGTITNRFWDFGDGKITNVTSSSVVHIYGSAGTNTVQLVVRGPGGASTNTQTDMISVSAGDMGTIYKYEPFDYVADTGLRYQTGYAVSGSGGMSTNRAGNLTYSGLPDSVGGKLQLYGQRPVAAGSVTCKIWTNGVPGGGALTNLFASFILNVANVGTIQSNQYIFSLRNASAQIMITNNASNPAKYNIGIFQQVGKTGWAWDSNGGSGYDVNTPYLIVMSYTNASANTYHSQVWINPSLSAIPEPANLNLSQFYVNSWTNQYQFGNGNGNPAEGTVIYVDELRVGSAWLSVIPVSAPDPEPKSIEVNTNALDITEGTTNSFQIRLSSQPSADVTVNISRISGDAEILAVSSSVVFSPVNWSVWQSVYIEALTDADTNNAVATIGILDAGSVYSATNVQAVQIDTTVIPPDSDADDDGIPDEWETEYFGGTTNANPNSMAANGVNTILEAYVAGLNPTNPAAALLISDFRPLTSASTLQWQSASGRVYSVYWTTNLITGFQPLETNILWPQNSWTDTVHGAQGGGYYRIKVQLGQ
jgi:uncharacterized protein (TIGR03790 family)